MADLLWMVGIIIIEFHIISMGALMMLYIQNPPRNKEESIRYMGGEYTISGIPFFL